MTAKTCESTMAHHAKWNEFHMRPGGTDFAQRVMYADSREKR
jgi:hypothetical protein